MKHKLTSLITTLALLTSLSGCMGESAMTESLDSLPAVTEPLPTLMAASASKWLCNTKVQPQQMFSVGEKVFWVAGDAISTTVQGYDLGTGEFLDAPFETLTAAQGTASGEITTAASVDIRETTDGIEVFYECRRFDEAYQWLGTSFHHDVYDDALQLVEASTVHESTDKDGFGRFCPDGADGWYGVVFEDSIEKICRYDAAFQKTAEMAGPVLYVNQFYQLDDLYVDYREEMMDGGSCIAILHEENQQLQTLDLGEMQGSCTDGKYLYVYDRKGIWQVRDGETVQVVDFAKANFNGEMITSVAAMADGSFVLAVPSEQGSDTECWHLTEADANAAPEVITLAGSIVDLELTNAANRYNRAQTDYRIEVKDYAVEGAADYGHADFQADLLGGDMPDIIAWNGLDFRMLSKKGICEDLHPWMEEEGCFTDENYFMNLFEELETNGEQLRMGFTFSIGTLAGKSELVGTQQGVQYADFRTMLQNRPAGCEPFPYMHSTSGLSMLCTYNMDCFVNEETAECRFDSPEFMELLEMCDDYPSVEEQSEQYNIMTEEELKERQLREIYQYREETTLLKNLSITDPYEWHYTTAGDFGGEDVTFIGYPMAEGQDGNGGMVQFWADVSMVRTSEHKEQVWDFFMTMLDESYQTSLAPALPVHRGAMDARCAAAMQSTEPDDVFDVQRSWRDFEQLQPIGNATQEEMAAFIGYVEGIHQLADANSVVLGIFWEEVDMHLAGDQTAAQTAEHIQSRVELYLSEQS